MKVVWHDKNIDVFHGGIENIISDLRNSDLAEKLEFIFGYFKFIQIYRSSGILLFGSYSTFIIFASFVNLFLNKPIIWVPCFHPFESQFIGKSKYKKMLKYFLFMFVVRLAMRRSVLKMLVFSKNEKIFFINHFGIDEELLQIVSLKSKFSKCSINTDQRSYDVGFFGRYTENKGIDIVEKLANKKLLSWVSSGSLPVETENYYLKAGTKVVKNPSSSDLRKLIDKTKVIIVPSTAESYGYVVLEALDLGAQVLCSRIPVTEHIANIHQLNIEIEDSREANIWEKRLRHILRKYPKAYVKPELKHNDIMSSVSELIK